MAAKLHLVSIISLLLRSKVAEGKKKFVFFSDICVPQNKNKFYLSMLWYCAQKFDLQYIEHKYFEKGHTRNENDSMHAAIERGGKKYQFIQHRNGQQSFKVPENHCHIMLKR